MSRDGKRRRGLSYEDRVLWTHVTKAITPLRNSSPLPLGEVDAQSAAGEGLKSNEGARPPLPKGERVRTELAAKPPKDKPKPMTMEPLTRRMKQRVARGKHQIDARLDLHGFTQHEAHAALLRFLRSANARDARLVLVITGKGRGGEVGVLRRQVPQWLGLPEFRDLVIGFEDAAIAHGGEGALYVRVRRTRGD